MPLLFFGEFYGLVFTLLKNGFFLLSKEIGGQKKSASIICLPIFGDPDENRTRVTAVKGRCLDRLTTGPYFEKW